jgi:hypothetical protein
MEVQMRTLVRSLCLAVALGAVPFAGAAAHECIVANRSDTGNEHATASGRWITVTLVDIYETTEQFGLPDLTAAQVTYAVELAGSAGVPDSFTFRGDKLIGGNGNGWETGGHATDGKGIDHFFETYGDRLVGALFAAIDNA